MSTVHRREFLGAAAVAAADFASQMLGDEKKNVAPNNKLTVALVGCGGMGRGDMNAFVKLPDFEVIALCDPDPRHIEEAAKDLKKAGRPTEKLQVEKDFRKVVERKDLDVVICGTPDHWHPYVLMAACANGKDVYCEKPLSHNIVEGRAMVVVEGAQPLEGGTRGTQVHIAAHDIDNVVGVFHLPDQGSPVFKQRATPVQELFEDPEATARPARTARNCG